MSDEFTIQISTTTGRGRITIGQDTHDTTQTTIHATRETAMDIARDHARAQGRSIAGTAYEDDQAFPLTITPQGQALPGTPAASPRATPGEHSPDQTADPEPIITQVPPPTTAPEPTITEASAQQVAPEWETPAAAPAIDETDPAWKDVAAQPATQGVRGTLNTLGMKLAPAEPELEQRRADYAAARAREEARRRQEEEEAHQAAQQAAEQEGRRAARQREAEAKDRDQRRLIQTNFQGVKTILVANPKGGARKTTSTYLLAATMGIIRGGSVIAWDANETMGTLGERSVQDLHTRTVVDLLEQGAPAFTSIEGSRLGALDSFVRPQGDSHFDVLASDEDATRQDIVDRAGFQTVHEILSRFYRVILVDTGNNVRVPHFLAAVEAADQLVVPVAAARDSARAAQKMMRSLIASGREELVRTAVVLIHDLEPSTEAGTGYLATVRGIADEFDGQVAAVVGIPFDAALKGGDEIDYAALSPATQRAYREAAAAVANSLRERVKKELA